MSETSTSRRQLNRAEPGSLRPTRLQVGLWTAFAIVCAALILSRFDSHPAMTGDSAAYTVLAASFFSPDGYGNISSPQGSPPSRFPFGYPALLAPIVALAPGNFEALRIPSLAATLINACLLFWGWRWLSRRSYWWALAVVALYCFSPSVVKQARLVLSEAVFMTFQLGSLILVEYGVWRRRRWWWYVAMGVLTFFMVYTRSVGWVILGGILVYLFYRWRSHFWIEGGRLGAVWAGCFAIALLLTPLELHDLFSVAYFRQYAAEAAAPQSVPLQESETLAPVDDYRLVDRLLEHSVRDLPSTIVPGLHSDAVIALARVWRLQPLLSGLAIAVVLTLALGLFRWQRQDGWSAFLAIAPPYLLVLLPWTWLGPRLLYPIQPQLSLAFLCGLEAILVMLTRRLRPGSRPAQSRPALAAAAVSLIAVSVIAVVMYPSNQEYGDFLLARSQWLKQHTAPDDILMSNIPATDFLSTGRKAVRFQGAGEVDTASEFWRRLRANGVDLILIDKTGGTWQADSRSAAPRRVYVYRDAARRVLQMTEDLLAMGAIVETPVPANYRFRAFAVQPAGF